MENSSPFSKFHVHVCVSYLKIINGEWNKVVDNLWSNKYILNIFVNVELYKSIRQYFDRSFVCIMFA